MSYKNKTYVIFDGDNDMWAYAFMKGWKVNEKVDFNFFDAHDLNNLRDGSSEQTVKTKLRERLASAKQAVVLIGEHTRYLYRFVRWELEQAIELNIPIVAVNLNGLKYMDDDRCPPIIRDEYVVHVSFKLKIIKFALDNFPNEFYKRKQDQRGSRHYSNDIYMQLGL